MDTAVLSRDTSNEPTSYLSNDNFDVSVLRDDGSNSSGVMGTAVCVVLWVGSDAPGAESFSNLENTRHGKTSRIRITRRIGHKAHVPVIHRFLGIVFNEWFRAVKN